MQATLDLPGIFEQESFTPEAYEALKSAAFAGGDAFDRFLGLLRGLEQKLSANPSPPPQQALKLGAAYALIGGLEAPENTEKALRWLNQAPAGAWRSYLLAQLHREQKRYADAIAEFSKAAEQGWNRLDCDLHKAETHIMADQFDQAQALLAAHASAQETSAQWPYIQARLLQARGENLAAIEQYQRALDIDENHVESMFRLAYLLDLYGDDHNARRFYERCARSPSPPVNALINLAIMYEDAEDIDDAADCLHRVLTVYPNHSRAQLYMKDVAAAQHMYFDEIKARTDQEHSQVLDIPVSDFELSVRSRNCLKKMNINTIGDLLRISERELLAYKNFGETSLNEIKAMLSQKGLRLGQYAVERPEGAKPLEPAEPEPPLGNPELLGRSLSTVELSVRSRKCLQRLGLNTVGDLLKTTEAELLAAKNFGHTSLSEIKKRLTEMGLSLRQPV